MVACKVKLLNAFPVEGLDTRDELAEERGEPVKDLITIPLYDGNPSILSELDPG